MPVSPTGRRTPHDRFGLVAGGIEDQFEQGAGVVVVGEQEPIGTDLGDAGGVELVLAVALRERYRCDG